MLTSPCTKQQIRISFDAIGQNEHEDTENISFQEIDMCMLNCYSRKTPKKNSSTLC